MITWIFKGAGSGIYGIYTCAQVGIYKPTCGQAYTPVATLWIAG